MPQRIRESLFSLVSPVFFLLSHRSTATERHNGPSKLMRGQSSFLVFLFRQWFQLLRMPIWRLNDAVAKSLQRKFLVRFLAGWRLSSRMTTVASDQPSSIRTRLSLLNRLKTGDDSESWREFYQI